MSTSASFPVILRAGDIESAIGIITVPAGSGPAELRRAVAELLRAAADEIDGPEVEP